MPPAGCACLLDARGPLGRHRPCLCGTPCAVFELGSSERCRSAGCRALSSWLLSPGGSSARRRASTGQAESAAVVPARGGDARHGPFGGHGGRDLAAVVEFVRFAACGAGAIPAVADRLSFRERPALRAFELGPGGADGRPVVNRRVVRRRRPQRPPAMLTVQQVGRPGRRLRELRATASSSKRCMRRAFGWRSCAACTSPTCTSFPLLPTSAARWPGRTCTSSAGRTTRTARSPSRSGRGSCR